ncbi:MAG: diaminopimelate epimerase [Candidatus Margulisiibacteriota bacterium]
MLAFTKMHGIGNDFIVIDGVRTMIDETTIQKRASALCNRHTGVGADGVILILPSDIADLRMRVFNTDGSEAEMCGNGIRCFAAFVSQAGLVASKIFTVQTPAGIRIPEIISETPLGAEVRIDMGVPQLDALEIQIKLEDGSSFLLTPVGMGNPHAVVVVPDVSVIPLATAGPLIERHPFFPHRTNVEFIQIVSRSEIKLRVWERGSGETLACGTGACASVVAGILLGKLSDQVSVRLPGGYLEIVWQKHENIFMTGAAQFVFEGTLYGV